MLIFSRANSCLSASAFLAPGSPPASLPVFPDPNAGIKPETLAYIEQQLKLM